jgi:hypothetical protein
MDLCLKHSSQGIVLDEMFHSEVVTIKSPICPQSIISKSSLRASVQPRWTNVLWNTVNTFPFSLARVIILSASALVLTNGFSTTTSSGE